MLKLRHSTYGIEAGCDEAGRGCLCGPVVAAAVILPKRFKHPLLNDSKQVTKAHREELRAYIEEKALHWAVASCSPKEIDEINILWASVLAMHRAVDQLAQKPEFLCIDGNRFRKYGEIPHATIIQGDGIYAHIAAASILAKTHRDELMQQLHLQHPEYSWDTNMGYPTTRHRDAIRAHGSTPHHRMTFRLLEEQMELPFAQASRG